MDSEVGGELERALPLTGIRLARCYLPWVNLAITQVPPRGNICQGQSVSCMRCSLPWASLVGKSLHA